MWENIIGGIVAAAVIAIYHRWTNRKKHRAIQDLIVVMDKAIRHRNIGKRKDFSDAERWVQAAKDIEDEAVRTANNLSPTASSLIQSLDRVSPYDGNNQVEKYISILSKVIERITGIMERHSY